MSNRKERIWRGCSGIFSSVLTIAICMSTVAFSIDGSINAALGIKSTKLVKTGDEDSDTAWYKSDYGDVVNPTAEDVAKLTADEDAFVIEEMEGSAVLLKNEENCLPLADDEKKITLFGHASVDPLYTCSSGGGNNDPSRQVDFYTAFTDAGFEVNDTLYNAYASSSTKRITPSGGETENIGEEPASFYTEQLKESFADYGDVAIVVLTREGGEGMDMKTTDYEGISQLALHQNEKDMMSMIKEYKDQGVFKKVVLIDNSPYALELDWMDEYGVDACLYVGTLGIKGTVGAVNLLTGAANPSGKLVDTYATNSLSSPAVQNFGDFTYTNKDEIIKACSDTEDNGTELIHYVVYQEGIYTGYKYYETRYEDCILGQGNADSTKGAFASDGAWNYADEVLYPFGYGLSYTSFEQKLKDVQVTDTEIKAKVKVTNTGTTAGRSVVELYVQTPYSEYDKENNIEKPAVQLAGFAKSGNLEAGASEEVTVTVDKYLIASYDANGAEGYVLGEGDYYCAIGENAHDALNNILAAKGASGMFDEAGNQVSGDASKTYHWNLDQMDTESYAYSAETGNKVTNLFEDKDINYFQPGAVKYLSRQDWDDTWAEPVELSATDEMITLLDGYTYEKPADASSAAEMTVNADQGIMLADMIGVDFDDPLWDTFIDQLSYEELLSCIDESNGNDEVMKIGKPSSLNGDGPDGTQFFYLDKSKVMGGPNGASDANGTTTAYIGESVAACSWDTEAFAKRGYFIGEDCLYAKVSQLWCPGGNIHRTPFSGRNFEYYSEDANLSYLLQIPETQAMMEKGVSTSIKHFAGNDQETNRYGVSSFMTEQTWRQVCLRGFEGSFTKGKITGTMTSFSRIGCTYVGMDSATLTGVLRDEWGFQGATISDAAAYQYQHAVEGIVAGTDMWCIGKFFSPTHGEQILSEIKSNDDGYLLECLKEANHRYYYAMANSNLMNGISKDTEIVTVTPWWKTAIVTADIVLGILTAICLAMYLLNLYRKENQISEEAK